MMINKYLLLILICSTLIVIPNIGWTDETFNGLSNNDLTIPHELGHSLGLSHMCDDISCIEFLMTGFGTTAYSNKLRSGDRDAFETN